jgi:5-oxoprolinase (ATP-hydrolysing)
MKNEFEKSHEKLFGYLSPDKKISVSSAEVESSIISDVREVSREFNMNQRVSPSSFTEIFFSSEKKKVPVYLAEDLESGFKIKGPVQVIESHSTIVVDPGWELRVTEKGDFLISKSMNSKDNYKDNEGLDSLNNTSNSDQKSVGNVLGYQVDPLKLEVFSNRFKNIAEEMGIVLQKTSVSVNIRERLDFSCALFNKEGALISNAPHIPVHLGSMGDSVKSVIRKFKGEIKKGDSFLLNSPYDGGTHLPDLTVVTPVFVGELQEPDFYLASRGHHPDVGGIVPGSMPAFSKSILEEGVLIKPTRIVDVGKIDEVKILRLFTDHQYPARNPQGNLSDIKAMLAANTRGIHEIERLLLEVQLDEVKFYMNEIMGYSSRKVIEVLHGFKEFKDVIYEMDTGSKISIKIKKLKVKQLSNKSESASGDKFLVDFTGSSIEGDHNHNCPRSVTRAAVLYVLRSLIKKDIPLNDGFLKNIEIRIPEGCFLNTTEPHAVVAGNVETSQAISNALFLSFGVQAASQGTMNNLLFGNEKYQYYETIAGGSGAGVDIETGENYGGADGVQTHMTNSKITDIEILEHRFPVRVKEFSIRKDTNDSSDLKTSHDFTLKSGGSGLVREIEFLEDMDLSILSSHRESAPPGLHGGPNGDIGENLYFEKQEDESFLEKKLNGFDQVEIKAGSRIRIKTPSGGSANP